MIRNKNLFIITIFLVINAFPLAMFASNGQAAANAASAVAAPVAAQATSSLASLDSNLGHVTGILKNTAMLIGIPTGIYYGYQWWSKTSAIKQDTEAIRKTQSTHGEQLSNIQEVQGQHGETLDHVRQVQESHSAALKQIGANAQEANEGVQEMRAGKTAWQLKLQRDVAIAGEASKAVLARLGLIETTVTTLKTDVDRVRTGVEQLQSEVKAGKEANAAAHNKTHAEMQAIHARIAAESKAADERHRELQKRLEEQSNLIIAHGVPSTIDRLRGAAGYRALNPTTMDFIAQLNQSSSPRGAAASGSPKPSPAQTPAANGLQN